MRDQDLKKYHCQYMINGFVLGQATTKIFDLVEIQDSDIVNKLLRVLLKRLIQ